MQVSILNLANPPLDLTLPPWLHHRRHNQSIAESASLDRWISRVDAQELSRHGCTDVPKEQDHLFSQKLDATLKLESDDARQTTLRELFTNDIFDKCKLEDNCNTIPLLVYVLLSFALHVLPRFVF